MTDHIHYNVPNRMMGNIIWAVSRDADTARDDLRKAIGQYVLDFGKAPDLSAPYDKDEPITPWNVTPEGSAEFGLRLKADRLAKLEEIRDYLNTCKAVRTT